MADAKHKLLLYVEGNPKPVPLCIHKYMTYMMEDFAFFETLINDHEDAPPCMLVITTNDQPIMYQRFNDYSGPLPVVKNGHGVEQQNTD